MESPSSSRMSEAEPRDSFFSFFIARVRDLMHGLLCVCVVSPGASHERFTNSCVVCCVHCVCVEHVRSDHEHLQFILRRARPACRE